MIRLRNKTVTVFESALFRTTSTLVVTDDLVLVVDPTWLPEEVETIRHWTEQLRGNRPVYLLFTHSDYDHILGYGAFPEASCIASRAFVDNPQWEEQLHEIRKFDDSNYIRRPYPIEYPNIEHVVERDGQQLRFGDTTLTFHPAPGHNPDGLFTFVDPPGIWLSGDYLSNIEFPYIYHSSRDYEANLLRVPELIERHAPQLLIPGHGDSTADMQEVRQRAHNDLNYIRQLRHDVAAGNIRQAAAYWQPIRFPGIMSDFHQKNIKLLQNERTAE